MSRLLRKILAVLQAVVLCIFVLPAPMPAAIANDYDGGTPIEIPPDFVPMTKEQMKELADRPTERLGAVTEWTAIGKQRLAEANPSNGRLRTAATTLPEAVDNSTLKYFPPIGNQLHLGSCNSFANTYYTFTYMTALAQDIDVKSMGETVVLSPSFSHNVNMGHFQSTLHRGALTLAQMPYNPDDEETIPTQASEWREALKNRGEKLLRLDISTVEDLQILKKHLYNGYVFSFGADLYALWELPIKNSSPKESVFYYNKTQTNKSLHQMTIVGYRDDVWMDKDNDGQVDSGELGALKIANSWGASWGNNGYLWLSYSAVFAMNPFEVETLTARSEKYTATLLAELDVDLYNRHVFGASLAYNETGKPLSHIGTPALLSGSYPYSGTLVYDFTDTILENDLTLQTTLYDWHLRIYNENNDKIKRIRGFRLTDGNGTVLAALDNIPTPQKEGFQTVTNLKITYGRTSLPPDTWVVDWEPSGGSPAPETPSIIADGATIDEPPAMEREGYDFGGWYLDSGFFQRAAFPLTVTEDMTLHARWLVHRDGTYLVPDTESKGAYIDLSTEELILPDGFSIAAYSVDGGTKWKKGPPKLSTLLNKPLQLALTDNYDSKAKRPAETAQVLRFPGIQARPKANPERLVMNYTICADLTGATPGAWTLAPRNGNQAKTDGIELALSSNKKTPDIQPDGSTWFSIGEDGIPVLPYGTERPTYLARSTPIVQDAMIVPASKIFKLRPLIQQKPTKLKADYKKEILKVKADGMIFGGDLTALKAVAENPQRATGAAGFDEGLVYQATKADRAGVSLTAILNRTGPDAVQTVCLWMPATAKKPATQVQEYRLARRAELLPQRIGGVNGRVRLPKTLEVLKSAGKWSSALPKVTQTATYENWVRVKAAARGTGFDDASQFAASRPAALTIEYGVYTPPDARKAKSGVLEVRVGDWQEEEAELEAA